jgi:hypothetical protein
VHETPRADIYELYNPLGGSELFFCTNYVFSDRCISPNNICDVQTKESFYLHFTAYGKMNITLNKLKWDEISPKLDKTKVLLKNKTLFYDGREVVRTEKRR